MLRCKHDFSKAPLVDGMMELNRLIFTGCEGMIDEELTAVLNVLGEMEGCIRCRQGGVTFCATFTSKKEGG